MRELQRTKFGTKRQTFSCHGLSCISLMVHKDNKIRLFWFSSTLRIKVNSRFYFLTTQTLF